jgi:hypothetical protein
MSRERESWHQAASSVFATSIKPHNHGADCASAVSRSQDPERVSETTSVILIITALYANMKLQN